MFTENTADRSASGTLFTENTADRAASCTLFTENTADRAASCTLFTENTADRAASCTLFTENTADRAASCTYQRSRVENSQVLLEEDVQSAVWLNDFKRQPYGCCSEYANSHPICNSDVY